MIDLHTHSLFSDGELLPSELVRRAEEIGYEAVAITDHADSSNLDWIVPRLVRVCEDLNRRWKIRAVPGIELTHLPPDMIAPLAAEARSLGREDCGRSRRNSGGAGRSRNKRQGHRSRRGHSGAPGFDFRRRDGPGPGKKSFSGDHRPAGAIAWRTAMLPAWLQRFGASLVLNTDGHAPGDLITRGQALKVALGAGLEADDFERMLQNSREIVTRVFGK